MAAGKLSPAVQNLVGFLCIALLLASVAGPAGAIRAPVGC
ncbi:unnamed protein product [Prunus brigantina]